MGLQRLSRPTNTSSKTDTEVDGTTINKEFNNTGSSETKINNNNNNTRVVAATKTSLLSEKFNSCCSLTETHQHFELARCNNNINQPRSKRHHLDENVYLKIPIRVIASI